MDTLFDAVRARDLERVRAILRQHPEAVSATNGDGATPLHYAAEAGDREIVEALLEAGADVNARDSRFDATPAGWAIETLRARGALLGCEIADTAHAIATGDERWVQRFVTRFPALRDVASLREQARTSPNRAITRWFESDT